MVTTIQINEHTLQMLKQLKEQFQAPSYEETIKKLLEERRNKDSIGGSLKKHYKKDLKEVLKELQEERRKSDRF